MKAPTLLVALLVSATLSAAPFDPAKIEVTVLGVPHLTQGSLEIPPRAIEEIREALASFEADQVVVEWLHPSIDPADTHNYALLGDRETLARLWGVDLDELEAERSAARRQLSAGEPPAALRVRLGKLEYLAGDKTNAAYQWWRAERAGAEIEELKRLAKSHFGGHELAVFGFHLAERWGLEEVTPFDYQGDDADWGHAYREMTRRTREIALEASLGLRPGDERWEEESARYDELLGSDPAAWKERYGRDERVHYLPRMAAFGAEMGDLFARRSADFETAGLGLMQTAEANEANRSFYYDLLWKVPIASLGRALVVNYERRNERMVDFVEADARRLGSKRILVIVGFGHKSFLDPIFEHRGYRVVPSSRYVK